MFSVAVALIATAALRANDLDAIGVSVLRQVDPTLNGQGVDVAHVEGHASHEPPPPFVFEVNPENNPAPVFTYISTQGTATNFPNAVGSESWHANLVGANFFGLASGVATNVARVYNYEADYFVNNIVAPLLPNPPAIPAKIANQSFILSSAVATLMNQKYDNYAAQHGTLFVSGVGNGDVPVSPPATSYNGIGVGVYTTTNSSIGPTTDGRSKPDIVAPGGVTSLSTPFVAGGAAILRQAALRGDGGTNVSAASDPRTLKALLLNGAVKLQNWTNSPTRPLDARYGSGILNVFNSWKQLSGGKYAFIESTSNSSGGAHPPGTNPNDVPALSGWDFNTITTMGIPVNYQERVNHYYFTVPPNSGPVTLTATLAWNRQNGQSAINDLNLFLYSAANSNLIIASTSAVDNVEHIFLPSLPPGRYDLQVHKNPAGLVSVTETYALAFEMFSLSLDVLLLNGSVMISWPASPSGFVLESASTLTPPVSWSPVNAPVVISNGVNIVSKPVTAPEEYFRLRRP